MKKRAIMLSSLVGISMLIGAAAASAQEIPLTLEAAVKLALSNESSVAIALNNITEAQLRKDNAVRSVFPNLAVSATLSYSQSQPAAGAPKDTADRLGYTFSLNQPMYTGGRARSAMRSADQAIGISAESYDLTREEVFLQTAAAFLGVLTAKRVVEAAAQGVAQAAEFLNLAQSRFELGDATRTSVLTAELEKARRESALVQAGNDFLIARQSLRKLLGVEIGELSPPAAVDGGLGGLPLEDLVARALAGRKELRIAERSLEMALEGITFAKGKFLPLVYANGYYAGLGEDFSPGQTENWGLSLNIDIPLYDRGQSLGDLKLARLAVEKSRQELLELKKTVRLDVERKYYELKSLEAGAAGLKKQVELTEENLRALRVQYEIGVATDLEVATALSNHLQAQVQLAVEDQRLIMAGYAFRKAVSGLVIPQ